ncbi:MAG: hypothetical protein ACRBB3_01280 [Alphaproteobacteria bacterium]
MKKITILLVIIIFSPLAAFSQKDTRAVDLEEMINDVKSIVKLRNDDDLWESDTITKAVKKHIPVDLEKTEIFDLLDSKKISYHKTSKKYSEKHNAEESYTSDIDFWIFPYFVFFDHTLVLFFHFKEEKLTKVQGRVKWNVL